MFAIFQYSVDQFLNTATPSVGVPWVKKEDGSFDVIMGACDVADVCQLTGIYMLYLIGKKYDSKNLGLYRDDGLAEVKNVSGPASKEIKKTVTIFI